MFVCGPNSVSFLLVMWCDYSTSRKLCCVVLLSIIGRVQQGSVALLPWLLPVQLAVLAGFDSHFKSVGKEYCYKLNCGVPQPMQVQCTC